MLTICGIFLKRGMGVHDEVFVARGPKNMKDFEQIENSAINISYRCNDCRNCQECKNGPSTEEISIQAEYEQNIINNSVVLDAENKRCVHKLPFIANPETKLMPNERTARRVFDGQVKLINKSSEEDKNAIIEAKKKLQDLGYVDFLDNLDEDTRNLILNSPVKHYMPWRLAWSDSLSTPVRPVYDASMRTPGGCSLNDILAKGANNLNNLVEILIRWTILQWAYHTDIRKMYNAVLLDKSHWCYHLYYWTWIQIKNQL